MAATSKKRRSIPRAYFSIVPAIYFMLLGLYDIGMDLLDDDGLSWYRLLFNATFLIPILFRRRISYLICGFCFSALWLYLLIGSLFELLANPLISTLDIWIVEGLIVLSLLCSLSMVYANWQKPAAPPEKNGESTALGAREGTESVQQTIK